MAKNIESSSNGACPKCKSKNIVKAGKALRKGGKIQSYKCTDCGHAFTQDKLILLQQEESVPLAERKLIGMAKRLK